MPLRARAERRSSSGGPHRPQLGSTAAGCLLSKLSVLPLASAEQAAAAPTTRKSPAQPASASASPPPYTHTPLRRWMSSRPRTRRSSQPMRRRQNEQNEWMCGGVHDGSSTGCCRAVGESPGGLLRVLTVPRLLTCPAVIHLLQCPSRYSDSLLPVSMCREAAAAIAALYSGQVVTGMEHGNCTRETAEPTLHPLPRAGRITHPSPRP